MTPIDIREARTGITAAERAETIRRMVDETSKPSDFVRPGHVYPLLAKEGGVLRRAGHTEASSPSLDLAAWRMNPAGVLCEILDPSGDSRDARSTDGTRART